MRAIGRASTELEPIVRLWILRVMVELGADNGLVGAGGVGDARLGELLGVELDVSGKHPDPLAVKRQLRSLLGKCEADQDAQQLPPCWTRTSRASPPSLGCPKSIGRSWASPCC